MTTDAPKKSFLQRKSQSGGPRIPGVHLEDGVHEDVVHRQEDDAGKDSVEEAIVERLAKTYGVTVEEMEQWNGDLLKYVKKNKAKLDADMASLQDRIRVIKSGDPKRIAEVLKEEIRKLTDLIGNDAALADKLGSGPLADLASLKHIGSKSSAEDLRKQLAKARAPRLKRSRGKDGAYILAGTGGLAVGTVLDFGFIASGFGALADVINGSSDVAKEVFSAIDPNQLAVVCDVCEFFGIDTGKAFAGFVATGGSLTFLGKRKWSSYSMKNMLWDGWVGKGTLAAVFGLSMLAMAGNDKQVINADFGAKVMGEILGDDNHESVGPKLVKAKEIADALPAEVAEKARLRAQAAYEEKSRAVGPLTFGTGIAMKGVKGKITIDGQEVSILDAYNAENKLSGEPSAFAGKDVTLTAVGNAEAEQALSKLQKELEDLQAQYEPLKSRKKKDPERKEMEKQIKEKRAEIAKVQGSQVAKGGGDVKMDPSERRDKLIAALAAVNKKYAQFGLGPTDGADKLLQVLSDPLAKKVETTQAKFDFLLSGAKGLDGIGYYKALLAKIPGVAWVFGISSPEVVLGREDDFIKESLASLDAFANLEIVNQYTADIAAAFKEHGKIDVNLNLDIKAPDIGITKKDIESMQIDRDKYKKMLHPDAMSLVRPDWSDEMWEARQRVVSKSFGVSYLFSDLKGSELQKYGLMSLNMSYFVFFIAGIGALNFWANRKRNSLFNSDLLRGTPELQKAEHGIAAQIFALHKATYSSAASLFGDVHDETGDEQRAELIISTLRRLALSQVTDEEGRKLSDTEAGKAFIEGKEDVSPFIASDRKAGAKLRAAYARFFEEVKNKVVAAKNPLDALADIARDVDPNMADLRDRLLSNIQSGQSDPTTEFRTAYEKARHEELTERVEILKQAIAERRARREYIEHAWKKQYSERFADGEDGDIDVELQHDGKFSISKFHLVGSYVLADIDAEIEEFEKKVENLLKQGADEGDEPALPLLSYDEAAKLGKMLISREQSYIRVGDGKDGKPTIQKLNEYMSALDVSLKEVRTNIESALRKELGDEKISAKFVFGYSYGSVPRGPSIMLEVFKGGEDLPERFYFTQRIPNDKGGSVADDYTRIKEWADPAGPLVQKIKLQTVFERYRELYREARKEVYPLPRIVTIVDMAAGLGSKIDEALKLQAVHRVQLDAMNKLSAGSALSERDLNAFSKPETISVWKSQILDVASQVSKRVTEPGKSKLAVQMFLDETGLLKVLAVSVPEDANLESLTNDTLGKMKTYDLTAQYVAGQ